VDNFGEKRNDNLGKVNAVSGNMPSPPAKIL